MIKKWWKDFKKKDMAKRMPGMEIKEASIKRKLESAMKILNRREENIPVDFDRRKIA